MRKFALIAAAAVGALAIAAPASAQYYPTPVYPGYPQPVYPQPGYGHVPPAYGYNPAAIVQSMDARAARIRAQVRDLQARGAIRWNKARTLDRQAAQLQRSIRKSAWNGLSPGEVRSLEVRMISLERRVQTAALQARYAPRYSSYRRY